MREEIQQLIASGLTEQAIQKLIDNGVTDAILLSSRYNQAKKQYSMGMVSFTDWNLIQSQINFGVLELAGRVRGGATATVSNGPAIKDFKQAATNDSSAAAKVFISYNHKDKDAADRINQYLSGHGVEVSIDRERIEAGQSIADFIKQNIRSNGYILSVVSENSLKSGWVGMESTASLFAEWIADKHFIPVALDDRWASNDFYLQALKHINDTVNIKEKEARAAKKLGGRTTHIDAQIKRLEDLKANLGQILEKLQSVLTVSVAGEDFDEGMQRVLHVIQRS